MPKLACHHILYKIFHTEVFYPCASEKHSFESYFLRGRCPHMYRQDLEMNMIKYRSKHGENSNWRYRTISRSDRYEMFTSNEIVYKPPRQRRQSGRLHTWLTGATLVWEEDVEIPCVCLTSIKTIYRHIYKVLKFDVSVCLQSKQFTDIFIRCWNSMCLSVFNQNNLQTYL